MSYIAHYPLISDMNDIFGHSALSIAGSSFIEEGILGHCLYFKNGSVSYIKLPELEGKKSFSISFRINVPKADALSQRADVFGFQNTAENGGNNLLRLEISGNQAANSTSVTLNIFNNGTWTNDGGFGAISITRNEWHHLAFSISEDKVRYYVDGIKKVEQDKTMNFSYSSHSKMNGNFKLGDGQQISFKIYDLQIYSHAISTKEVKKIYQTCVFDYTFNDPGICFKNLYSGQYNLSYQTLTTVETDIFKEYGFDTAQQFKKTSSTVGQNLLLYSYIVPTNISSANGYDKDTEFGISFYAYVPDDFDGLIRISCEQSTTFQLNHCYCSEPTRREWTTSNISITTKGKIVYFSLTVKPNSNNALYLMFYWSKSEAAFPMDHGYVLIAGMQFYPIVNGMYHIPPLAIESQSPNYGIIQDGSGRGYDSTGYNIHPPVLTTDTNIGKYAYRAQNDGSCVYFPLPLNNKNIQGTVEIWIKLYSSKTYQGIIGCSSYSGSGVWISAQTEGNALWFYNGSYYRSDSKVLPNSKFTLNEWHQIVAVWKDKSLSWYFDGNFINTVTNEKTFAVSDSNIRKMHFGGYYPEKGSLSWNTKLDAAYSSIKFYAKYLTAEEIKSNYDEVSKFQIDNFGGIHASALTEEAFTNKSSLPKTKSLVSNSFDEISLQDMQTKMLDDGSVWARIFHHNCTGSVYFSDDEPEHFRDINNPAKYSLLYLLNSDKFKNSDGKYEFLLEYPDDNPGKYNRWKQSSNPCTSTTVSGYEAIHIDWTSNSRGGLLLNSGNDFTFIKGSTTSAWFYSIGSRISWSGGLPGYTSSKSCTSVNLYVRIDNLDFFDEIEENSNNAKIFKNIIHSSNFNERGK